MILSGEHPSPLPDAAGLLVVGDPHVSSRRPGRRRDGPWPEAILGKLAHCVALANERDLAPVILGDLFDQPVEADVGLISRLVRLLKEFRHRPLVNVGNHDIAHTHLSEGDSLALLALADVIDVVALSGPVGVMRLGGARVGIGMTPYGQAIPTRLAGGLPGAERVVWFTHHDIAFEATYPGAVAPFAVAGCDLVVNGHVHRAQTAMRAGGTLWANPGSIVRKSVDLIDQAPRAWILGPDGGLAPETLPHAADVFDLTGRLIEAAEEADVARAVESAFVSLLQAESATDLTRSGDGSVLAEEMAAKFARDATPEAVRAVVRSLLDEAVARRG